MTTRPAPLSRLSLIVPTLNAAAGLSRCLDAILSVGAPGEIIVVDGGSTDATRDIATAKGARVIIGQRGRGVQLATGAVAATGDWLLFIHADTVLQPGWDEDVNAMISDPGKRERAGYFRFALDDLAPAARRLEYLVAWRSRAWALPYGDQGLLISRDLYDKLGGYRPLPLMEDVDLIQRMARGTLVALNARAVTSAARYHKDGYLMRPLRNIACQILWRLGLPIEWVARLYR